MVDVRHILRTVEDEQYEEVLQGLFDEKDKRIKELDDALIACNESRRLAQQKAETLTHELQRKGVDDSHGAAKRIKELEDGIRRFIEEIGEGKADAELNLRKLIGIEV